VLAVHLGMTGRFSVQLPPTPNPSPQGGGGPARRSRKRGGLSEGGAEYQLGEFTHEHGHDAKHDHLVLTMSGGAVVTYNDARRFGYMTLVREIDLNDHAYFAGLGVEPLSEALSPAHLAGRAQARKVDLKALLMDQRVVAGLGNIYVCEALFRSHLSPRRLAATLATKKGEPTDHSRRLVTAIHEVLNQAIKAGGSSLRDHRQTDGELGYFQHSFQVYDREGKPCQTAGCSGIVKRFTQNGRSTFWCPKCQK